jgi:hypothetical protein
VSVVRTTSFILLVVATIAIGIGLATDQWLVNTDLDRPLGLRADQICYDHECRPLASKVDPGYVASTWIVQLAGPLGVIALLVALVGRRHDAALGAAVLLGFGVLASGALLVGQPFHIDRALWPGWSFWSFQLGAAAGLAAAIRTLGQRAVASTVASSTPTGTV